MAKNEGVVGHRMPDGTLALADADRGVMLVVNELGEAVWYLADDLETLEEVASTIATELAVEPERVQQDVATFVAALREHGLVR